MKLLDEDVHPSLAEALRRRGYDAVHLQDVDRKGVDDAAQLEYAAEQRRCFISFNVGDFARLHVAYLNEDKTHAGILLSKQRPVGEVLRRLISTLNRLAGETLQNRLEFF